VLFVEPDLGNQVTALAAAPVSGVLCRAFGKYPLASLQESP